VSSRVRQAGLQAKLLDFFFLSLLRIPDDPSLSDCDAAFSFLSNLSSNKTTFFLPLPSFLSPLPSYSGFASQLWFMAYLRSIPFRPYDHWPHDSLFPLVPPSQNHYRPTYGPRFRICFLSQFLLSRVSFCFVLAEEKDAFRWKVSPSPGAGVG